MVKSSEQVVLLPPYPGVLSGTLGGFSSCASCCIASVKIPGNIHEETARRPASTDALQDSLATARCFLLPRFH